MKPIRVLVVDDSAFARKVLRQSLSAAEGIEVVDIARDGLEALDKVAQLNPDVVALDLVMPHLDGLGVLEALKGRPSPRVVVVSSVDDQSDLVIAALAAGAVDFVHKPTALATDRLYGLATELAAKVRLAAAALGRPEAQAEPMPASVAPVGVARSLVVMGTSTGGPQALTRLIPALPANFPAPIAVVLHIPAGYTEALAKRLADQSKIEVLEAEHGMPLRPGRVVLARAGWHMTLAGRGEACVAHLGKEPAMSPHRPSVDVLFSSAAAVWGADTIGVVMTGMGNDGLVGARSIREAGGRVMVESASSSVIYGMPRSVKEAGLANFEAPLEHLAARLTNLVQAEPPAVSRHG